MAKSIVQEFTKGLWEEIPPFRLVLGLCPCLLYTSDAADDSVLVLISVGGGWL